MAPKTDPKLGPKSDPKKQDLKKHDQKKQPPSQIDVGASSPTKTTAERPHSPTAKRSKESQRTSDRKAAKLLGVDRIKIDYNTAVPKQHQHITETLKQQPPLKPPLPTAGFDDIRKRLSTIWERSSGDSQRVEKDVADLLLKSVRFDGALQTDPENRPSFDGLTLDTDSSYSYYEESGLKKSFEADRPRSAGSSVDLADPFKLEGGGWKGKGKLAESAKSPENSIRSNSFELAEAFLNITDLDTLAKIDEKWHKQPGVFMPSPSERRSLIVARKTMARLLTLSNLLEDILTGTGLPLNGLTVEPALYQLVKNDTDNFQTVRSTAIRKLEAIHGMRRCQEYDLWAVDHNVDNMMTLACGDCNRHLTEGWASVFREYASWAWNLPDNGELARAIASVAADDKKGNLNLSR